MFFTVHSAKSHKALSAPLATYRDALRWVKDWQSATQEGQEIALRIVAHNGFPSSPMYTY